MIHVRYVEIGNRGHLEKNLGIANARQNTEKERECILLTHLASPREGREDNLGALQMSLSVQVRYFGGWNPLDGNNKVTSHACSPLNNS